MLYTVSSGNPETRKNILNSAWKLLEAAQGREVRMTDIAREAGVSRQALYLHFPARSVLLVATPRHIDEVEPHAQRSAHSPTPSQSVANQTGGRRYPPSTSPSQAATTSANPPTRKTGHNGLRQRPIAPTT